MIAYTATVLGFWVAVTLCTLGFCRLIDVATRYFERCRACRRHHVVRSVSPVQRVPR